MSLRILLLRKKLDEKKNRLTEVEKELEAIKNRADEIEAAISEMDENTDEETEKSVEEMVDELEKEKSEKVKAKKSLEEEISDIEKSISEIEEDTVDEETEEDNEVVVEEERKAQKQNIKRRGDSMILENMNTRERVGRILERDENKRFFRDVVNLYFNREAELAGLSKENAGLLVPDDVYYEINQRIGEYGSLYKVVRKLDLVGKARIIMNAGTPKLFWTEKCEPLKEVTLGTLNAVELDNYKLGGYLFLCESFVQDVNENRHHSITIADYIMNEFAKAIAEELDRVIYDGKGSAEKQPEGITAVVKSTKNVSSILDVLGYIGELDVEFHQHNAPDGKITVAGNRRTLYKWIYPETWGKDANGKLVYGMGNSLPDGTQIVLSNVIPDNELVIGDFNQYILGIRKEMTFDTNDRLQWIEENIGYKIRGRYDGKVANSKAFLRLKFVKTAASTTTTGGEG